MAKISPRYLARSPTSIFSAIEYMGPSRPAWPTCCRRSTSCHFSGKKREEAPPRGQRLPRITSCATRLRVAS
jgi:hypothetical protein